MEAAPLIVLLVGFYCVSWGIGFEAGKKHKRKYRKRMKKQVPIKKEKKKIEIMSYVVPQDFNRSPYSYYDKLADKLNEVIGKLNEL